MDHKTTRARALVALGVVTLAIALARSGESARYDKAPEFPSQDPKEWIGPPQSLKALAGKVVILDVWTFG
jgi:hypothetical protein